MVMLVPPLDEERIADRRITRAPRCRADDHKTI
jgi:hypothetical protein